MGLPRFLVLNYLNDIQHASHVLSANEQSGNAWKVGAARRSPGHFWTPDTANLAAWVKSDAGSAKAADMMVVDRVHNLGGVVDVKLQKSSDNFVANTVDVVTFTIPSAASADNTALSTGVRTPEGAYLRTFTSTSERYWRLLIPAMGAGLKPKVGGLWLGPSWQPPAITRPHGEDDHAPLAETSLTPWGWEGRTLTIPRRSGVAIIELIDEASYLIADGHIRDQFVRRPMWLVFDEAKAERAFLARWPVGERAGFGLPTDYPYRTINLPYEEHQPLISEGAA
jgi:hypothetical protein